MLSLDHVLVLVPSLEVASDWWLTEHGLGTVPGGTFDDGVVTALIPVGGMQYVELLEVARPGPDTVDLQALAARGGGFYDWAVRTTDIAGLAARTGRAVGRGRISGPDGSESSWQYVENDPGSGLPFVIQYDDPAARPGRWHERYARAGHRRRPEGLERVATPATAADLAAWIGDTDIPVVAEAPSLSFTIAMTDGPSVRFDGEALPA